MDDDGSPAHVPNEIEAPAPIDKPTALARLGDDEALFREFARSVVDEAPGLLAEIRAALDGGRIDDAHRAAHGLKGMLATLEARPAAAAAREIEQLTQDRKAGEAAAATDRLAVELDRLARAVATMPASGDEYPA
ncbi:MAG TPA: Hpt domain-containing protein [Planctomycetaceae bacterium]